MILSVTPNPMLDKTLWLSQLQFGKTHRAHRLEEIAGGKGINVSRALRNLGENTLATGFAGGYTGAVIRRLLDAERIPHDFVEIAATTRIGFTLMETDSTRHTAVFEPGHQLQAQEVAKLVECVSERLPQCRALALCGSMPCEGFDHLYVDLIRAARQANVPVFLDSYHAPLRHGLAAGPNFLKPNRDEVLNTFGFDVRRPADLQQALAQLVQAGAQYIFITDGERPVHVFANDRQYVATPPAIDYVNALGSGDTMVAAFLYGWLRNMPEEELIRFALAAGAVNAAHDMPGYANLAEIKALAPRVHLQRA